jgi:hypothetical protein
LAKKEFEKAGKEASGAISETGSPATQPAVDPLLVAAKELGISTEGKTKQEIAQAIAEKSSTQ